MALPISILSVLQHQHLGLGLIIDGLPDPQLRKMVQVGKWSIFENIVHLATYQHTFLIRVEKMLSAETPSFSRYTAETDPLFQDNLERTTSATIEDLVETRKSVITKIASLTEPELTKKGLHPAFGPMTILQWTEFFLLHEAHHLFTIFKLAAELRKD